MNDNRKACQALRDAADFLEKHPQPYLSQIAILIPCDDKEEIARLTQGAGGLSKEFGLEHFGLRKTFADNVYIEWYVHRNQVCEKIVHQKIVPAQPAQPERIEEVIEWSCPKSILAELAQ